MLDIEELPATDALRLAARVGVDLDRFGALAATNHGLDPADDGSDEIWNYGTGLRREPGPIEERLQRSARLLAVPVVPVRGPRGAAVCEHVAELVAQRCEIPHELLETMAGQLVDFDTGEPGTVEDAGIVFWPVSPAAHHGHHGGRCRADDLRCWPARAAATTTAGRWIRETVGWRGVVAPPLLAPPRRLTRRMRRRFEAELGAAVAGTVIFIPGPLLGV